MLLRFLGCLRGSSWERLGPPGGLPGGGAGQEKKETKKDKESNKKERKNKPTTTPKETPAGQNLVGEEQNHKKNVRTRKLKKTEKRLQENEAKTIPSTGPSVGECDRTCRRKRGRMPKLRGNRSAKKTSKILNGSALSCSRKGVVWGGGGGHFRG